MDAKLYDEPGRLAALHRYDILDTGRESAFERITGLVKTVMQVPMCAVSLIDAERQWFKSCVGLNTQQTARHISFCTHTITRREPLLIPDAQADERFRDNPLVTGEPWIRSYLGVPLATPDGYNVGSLCAIDTRAREFTPDQVAVMQSFAALVVDELELRRIAQTDHLTGAATRRSFVLELEKAVAQYKRSQTDAALVMLDVDHFKRVNDTYGHAAGDKVLKAVTAAVGAELRESDLLGRLGGEEFGVLLRGASLEEAMAAAERFRAAIEATLVEGEPAIKVTASFGVAAVAAVEASPQAWMTAADEMLYQAKRGGRNQCRCFAPVGAAAGL